MAVATTKYHNNAINSSIGKYYEHPHTYVRTRILRKPAFSKIRAQ